MKLLSKMYKALSWTFVLLACTIFSACDDDTPKDEPNTGTTQQTLLMYLPWSGADIYSYLLENIQAFETSIVDNQGLDNNRLVVFVSSNETQAYLIEISYRAGVCERDTLKKYKFDTPEYTTSSGITSIINDVITEAPANSYAMTIGCHGMGWLPAGTKVYTRAKSVQTPDHLTRFFGHSSDSRYQTDISTLANGITNAGIKMKYILFDDCYMSNIETAYGLRYATDYLVASTCEVMIEGMPYAEIGKSLLNNDLQGIVDGFYSFYSNFSTPCGTIGVTDCREVESMAQIMRQINTAYPDGVHDVANIQPLDGLTSTIFFDFGDYVDNLCEDATLHYTFRQQLAKLVPYKANTETFYSMYNNKQTKINAFSGLTISDPSNNSTVKGIIDQTEWYSATH